MPIDLPDFETLHIDITDIAAHITLNRPDVRNAMNYQMVAELYEVFSTLHDKRDVRAVVLSGAGGMFCAGGDIKEMRTSEVPAQTQAGNLDDMLRAINHAPQVVIAQVEGGAFGGGFGLVCVSDIAIAAEDALFALPEVRLGVAPAFISPFVIQRIGLMRARELMLTGRRFDGQRAFDYHLVHDVVPANDLTQAVQSQLDHIRECAPGALAATKALIFDVMDKPLDETVAYRANLLNQLRGGEEGQEGLLAFKEKRSPAWTHQDALTHSKGDAS